MKQATKRIALLAAAASLLMPMATAAKFTSRSAKFKAMKETLAVDKVAIKAEPVYADKNAKQKGFPWMKYRDVKEIRAPKAFHQGLTTTIPNNRMKAPSTFTINPNAVYGSVIDMPGWPVISGEKPYALYEVTQKDANNLKKIVEHHGLYAGGGGVMADGKYYAIDSMVQSFMGYNLVTYYTYDANTWECIGDDLGYDFTDEGSISSDLAYDPTTGMAYGTFIADEQVGEEGPYVFGAMQFEDDYPFRGEAIAECGEWYLCAIGCTPSGQLYGIDPEGKFYAIDKTNGEKTLIAETGLANTSLDLTTGTIDPYTGKFIYFLPSSVTDEESYTKTFYLTMYTIDCTTGAITEIGQVENGPQLVGGFMYPAPPSEGAPGAVTELTATPAADGVLKATLSFTAPTVTTAGEPLTQLETVQIRRGTNVITSKACSVGEKVTIEIETVQGNNELILIPYNASGAGTEARVSVFTGVDIPADPASATATVQEDGTVLVSWEAVTTGLNGGYIDPTKVTYNVYSTKGSEASRLTTNSFVYTPADDTAEVIAFQVFAHTAGGGSPEGTQTNSVPIGKAYQIPFTESFPNAYVTSGPWTMDNVDDAEWGALTDQGEDLFAADGDNGFAVFIPGNTNKSASLLYTVKIDISNATNPMLSFMYAGAANNLKAQVARNGGKFEDVKVINLKADPKADWAKVTVDLADYKDSDFIQIGFLGEAVDDIEQVLVLDAIRVYDNVGKDLAINDIYAPARVQAGNEFEVVVNVENRGQQDVEAFSVKLMRNGHEVASEECDALAADARKDVSIKVAATPAWGKSAELTARVVLAGDQATYNDLSEAAPVIIEQAAYPTTELRLNRDANCFTLEWDPVNLDNIKTTPITEDFEDPTYEDFTISDFGDWKLRDEDKSLSTYVVGIPVPGQDNFYSGYYQYPNVGAPMAFQLLNPRKAGMLDLSPEWTPKSGDRMMVAFNAEYVEGEDDIKVRDDDWLISPLLPGTEQQISLWARAVSDMYGAEQLQILYSVTGTEISDFVRIKSLDITGTWTEVKADLPEGTKYFAVRCTSLDIFALMVDDISFVPDWQLPADCDVTGYNLYRNGTKVNDAPLTVTTYTDNIPEDLNVEFVATVVYSNGVESCASNPVKLNESGVSEVADGALAIFGGKGVVNIISEESVDVHVYDTAGRLVAAGQCNGNSAIALPAGIYVVKAGAVSAKAIVR